MVEWDAQSIAVVIAATAAAVSGVIAAIRLSRCTTVDCLCFHMKREPPAQEPARPAQSIPALMQTESEAITPLV